MQKYQDVVLNQNGNPVSGVQVTVTDLAGSPVAVYSSNAIGLNVNPLTSDNNGRFSFYAPDGRYSLTFTFGGNVVASISDILLEDPMDGSDAVFNDVTMLGSLSDASKITSAAVGGISATNVQDALSELDSDKASNADLSLKVNSADLAASSGSALVGADDGSGGSLFTTVAGFISRLMSPAGSALVGFKQSGTGAVSRTAQAKMREAFSLSDYFDPSEGAGAMHNALTRLCNEAPRQTVEIDIGNYDWTLGGDFTLPTGKHVLIGGSGSIDFNGGSFLRTVHNKFTALNGFRATGEYSIFKFDATPEPSAYMGYEIVGIHAAMNSGVWALMFNGAREGVVDRSYFRSGKGIYRTLSNICHVSKSFFLGLEHAVFDEGLGSGFSCGLHIADSEVLGCKRSVVVSECDDGVIQNCTIDYNDEGIYLLGQDRFKVFGGYIGTRTAQSTTPNVPVGGIGPGLNIIGTASENCQQIRCVGVQFTGHDDGNLGYSNVYIEKSVNVTIADCGLDFYTQNAVRYGSDVTYLNIHDCMIANKGGSPATKAIECTSTDSTSNRFTNNVINPGQSVSLPLGYVTGNIGWRTRNFGEVVAGSGVSSVVVNHGLAVAPLKSEVTITPTNSEAASKNPFVMAVSSTQITIGFSAATTANAGVAWVAEKLRH